LSGMLFKSTRGVRPMLISGGIVASVAGAWAVGLYPFHAYNTLTELLTLGNEKGALLIAQLIPSWLLLSFGRITSTWQSGLNI
jgi:hypothetical protein